MVKTQIAPRPVKGLQRTIYNVLHDMDCVSQKNWLTVAEIVKLLPESAKGYGCKKKVSRAMGNMCQRGYAIGTRQKGTKFAKYQIAPISVYNVNSVRVKKQNDKARAKKAARSINGKVAKNAVSGSIEHRIKEIDAEILTLQEAKEKLTDAMDIINSLV
jgi:hypothetical protein